MSEISDNLRMIKLREDLERTTISVLKVIVLVVHHVLFIE